MESLTEKRVPYTEWNRFRATDGVVKVMLPNPSKYKGATLTCQLRLCHELSTQDTDLIISSNTEVPMFMDFLSSLLVSLLTCWLHPTTSHLTIKAVPPIAVEGENVLLFVHNLPKNVKAFSWYSGAAPFKCCEIASHVIATNFTAVGLAHSGRETVLNNGSLLIKSVTRKDSGYYTLRTLDSTSRPEIIRAEFFVHRKSIFCELCCWVGSVHCTFRGVLSLNWIYILSALCLHVVVGGSCTGYTFWRQTFIDQNPSLDCTCREVDLY